MSMADLAAAYLQDAADVFGIDAEIVAKPDARFDDDKSRLVLVEEKSLMGATTAGFAQHLGALQIWEAGASVTMQEKPAQVVSAQSAVPPRREGRPASTAGRRSTRRSRASPSSRSSSASRTRSNSA